MYDLPRRYCQVSGASQRHGKLWEGTQVLLPLVRYSSSLCGFNLGPVESSGPPELRPVHTSYRCSHRPHALPLEGYSLSSKGYLVINWESVNTETFFKNCFSVLVGT